jgi:ligand-binding sensor domain-containing protein/signal transduction histidine kinase
MSRVCKNLITVFLYLLLADILNAQKGNMVFHYLTTDNGLSQNFINCILRDSRGNMWFGSHDGLNKYNGSQITIYRNQAKNKKSISCELITDIHEDADKNIWVATQDGLNLYVPADGSFVSFKNIPSDNSSISGNYINCIYSDKQHNVWFGVENGNEGLNKWNPHTRTFTRYKITCSKHTALANAVTGIVQDKNGSIWVASWDNGLFRFEPNKSNFTCYKDTSLSLTTIKRLYIDNENTIWVATAGDGLFSFNPANNKFTKYNSLGDGKGTSGNVIDYVIQENNDNLLIAVDQGGINRYNKRTKLFEYINYKPNNPSGLNNNGILYLYKDKEGILWVGTSGGGVNIYNPKSEKFKLFRNIPGEPNSLSYDVVGSIYEDSKGLLWIATDGGGVSVYNPKTKKFKNYKKDRNDPFSLQCDVIRHVVEDNNHNYWIGTWEGGLIKLDHKTGRFTQYLPESNKPFDISGRRVWNSVVDHNGTIWLSLRDLGVDLLNPDKGIIKRFRPNLAIRGDLNFKKVNFMYEDRHLNMWLCSKFGLSLFDSVTNSFKTYKGFLSNDIKSFVEDKEGHYWAGTFNKGIMRFKENGDILKIYDTSNGLPSNLINGILEDENNNIWVSTGDGISSINYKTGKIRNYTVGDGLQGRQFFVHSCLKTRSGEMYFGGFNGFNSFFPDSLKDNDYIPQVYINEFLIFNKPVPVGEANSPLQNLIEQTKEITLNWKHSVFSFGFVAINYTHPENNQYAYKMEGFDKDWTYTGANRRLATYTNLDPGTYTFRVKASNNDGVWNEQGASLKITIVPPWWKTWWFKSIIVSVLLALAFSVHLLRVVSIKKYNRKLEQEVAERTEQLDVANEELSVTNDELETTNESLITVNKELETANKELEVANKELEAFSYSVSHDLKAPLRHIEGFSQILSDNYQNKIDDQGKSYLQRIQGSALRMSQLIDDMLSLSRISRSEMMIQDVNLGAIAKEIADNLRESQPGRMVNFSICDELPVRGDGRLLRIVLENLMGNAWKYTSRHQSANIEVGLKKQDNTTIYYVRDDGAGFDMNFAKKLFGVFQRLHTADEFPGTGIGLATVQRIIYRHGGKVWAESEVEKGATFYFTIP